LYLKFKLLFTSNEDKFLYLNFNKIFDYKNIENINSNNFINNYKINASKNSINEYKIINMINEYKYVDNIVKNININNNIYNITKNLLPNININGKNINIEQCVFVDLLKSNVQSFPSIHTDIEWGVFNNSDGFQVWYLYENEDTVGNMFLFDTEIVKPFTYLEYKKDGKFIMKDQFSYKTIEEYNINNMKMKVKYLNMKKGECLIFGKNLYHMSDFRQSKYRYAINFRVIIKDSDGGIPIDLSAKCSYNKILKMRLYKNNIKVINNKIYPQMFSLLNFI
jgi:hypothetical protein